MATKAASFARELKLIRSDLSFMQDRCALLEEENRRLRDGFDKGLRPEEDDLVRLCSSIIPNICFWIVCTTVTNVLCNVVWIGEASIGGTAS